MGWEPRAVADRVLQGGGNSPGERDMIVLDEDSIGKIEAVILAAAAAHGVFVDHAQAGRGFASIEDTGVGAGDGVDEFAGVRVAMPLMRWRKFRMTRSQRKKHARVVADDGDGLAFVQAHAIEDFGMRGDFVVRSGRRRRGRRKRRESARCCRCRRECNPVWRGWWRRRADWDRCRRSSWHRAWRGLRAGRSR